MLTQIPSLNTGRLSEPQTWYFAASSRTQATKTLLRSSGIHEMQVVASVSQARQTRFVFGFPATGELVVSVLLVNVP